MISQCSPSLESGQSRGNNLLSTQSPVIIWPSTNHALVALHRTAHTTIDVAELLPIVNILVSVIDVEGAGYEVAVLAAVGKGGEAGG